MQWDQLLVYLIVAAAALYLAWTYLRKRKQSGCGGCESACGSTPKQNGKPQLVQLELTPPRKADDEPQAHN